MHSIGCSRVRSSVLALAAALLLGAPLARAELVTIEQAFETDTTAVSLPDRVDRAVTLPGCEKTCPSSVRLTADTVYVLAGRRVTLAEMRAHLARGRQWVTLFYDPKTLVLNRVVAY